MGDENTIGIVFIILPEIFGSDRSPADQENISHEDCSNGRSRFYWQ